jgi:hypothetical protein
MGVKVSRLLTRQDPKQRADGDWKKATNYGNTAATMGGEKGDKCDEEGRFRRGRGAHRQRLQGDDCHAPSPGPCHFRLRGATGSRGGVIGSSGRLRSCTRHGRIARQRRVSSHIWCGCAKPPSIESVPPPPHHHLTHIRTHFLPRKMRVAPF